MFRAAAKNILREYEISRAASEQLAQKNKQDAYQKIPELKEIDSALKMLGLSLARIAVNDSAEQFETIKERINSLKARRKTLLQKNKIKEADFVPKFACNLCKDTGYAAERPTTVPVMCNCFKQKLIDAHYALSNLDNILNKENFDNFDFRLFSEEVNKEIGFSESKNMQHIHQAISKFTNNFGKEFRNLLMQGEAGLGKSFVCHCIAKELLDKGFTVLYITSQRLAKAIEESRSYYEDHAESKELLTIIDDVDLFILDDLGSEVITQVTQAIFFDIINHRLITNKPTIITTNLDPDLLQGTYTDRIASRLIYRYDRMTFIGSDIRQKEKLITAYGHEIIHDKKLRQRVLK